MSDSNQNNRLETFLHQGKKIGILGGGQLGLMLCQAASNWRLPIWIMDQSAAFPAGNVCDRFIEGNFKDYDDVLNFGRQVDLLTIEIEHVNTAALIQLQKEGIEVHPNPQSLDIIKDKGIQKEFYKKHNIPTSPFGLYDSKSALEDAIGKAIHIPFVIKYRTAGYDGKGVQVVRSAEDMNLVLTDVPMMVEELVDIEKEISVIAAKNPSGDIATFPVVEMEFHPTANLVEFLSCPSDISEDQAKLADKLARQIISAMDINGLLAVEMFLTKSGEILINEVAPRPHNSGHQSIEGNLTSQYEQHLRGIMDMPLGNTDIIKPSVMINLLGAKDHTGDTKYVGIDKCADLDNSFIHLYGKTTTKPFRKMGHATVIADDLDEARRKATFIKRKSNHQDMSNTPKVGIIMGSDSDLPIMKQAAEFLEDMNISFEIDVVSAHRTPEKMMDYAQNAHDRGIQVIIAGAGGAAHLPGMVASMTPLPVIGVPVKSSNSIDGWDSILSILQMPNGIPVATVALNAGKNAGILAARIIGATDSAVCNQMIDYQKTLKEKVLATGERLKSIGHKDYKKA